MPHWVSFLGRRAGAIGILGMAREKVWNDLRENPEGVRLELYEKGWEHLSGIRLEKIEEEGS